MKAGRLLWFTAFAVLALVVLWSLAFPVYYHRYKLTVDIEADGKMHRGVGIVDVRFTWHGPLAGLFQGNLYETSLDGRAAYVDLGRHGAILGLVDPGVIRRLAAEPKPPMGEELALIAFYGSKWWLDAKGREGRPEVLNSIRYERGTRDLDPQFYPAFVWLRDPTRRESAVPITPKEFSTVIAPSVRLESVVIEITHEALDDGIFSKLPWLKEAKEDEQKHGTLEDPRNYQLTANQVLGFNR